VNILQIDKTRDPAGIADRASRLDGWRSPALAPKTRQTFQIPGAMAPCCDFGKIPAEGHEPYPFSPQEKKRAGTAAALKFSQKNGPLIQTKSRLSGKRPPSAGANGEGDAS